tara:strand:- start:5 stop:304 length:300 start_codon:yes stop_codon:yes gene_type:complete
MEELHPKTIACLRVLRERQKTHNIFRDGDHIFGVKIISDKIFPERDGIIIYGPNNPENCQAFILGMKEIMCRKKEDEMIVEWVNLRNLIKKLNHYELLH